METTSSGNAFHHVDRDKHESFMSVLMYLEKLMCVRYFLVLPLDDNIIVFTLPYLRVIFFAKLFVSRGSCVNKCI